MKGITPRQQDALLFLRAYTKESGGVPPSYQQIADALNLKSRSNIDRIVKALEERGYIERLHRRHRSIILKGGI